MRAYYGSLISENMTMTPEGFLICRNVPIARTGTQEYLPSEIGLDGDVPILVNRLPEDVFATATLASFEGKPVTKDHPNATVEPGNAIAYIKGHAQNVRRGVGEESDLILSDLFITDPELIRLIRDDHLREVSCGYECEYVECEDGQIVQRSIRGNHVAVVMAGRAGSRVAIKDEKPTRKERGKKGMSKSKQPLLARLFAGWAKDAEPDEVAEVIEEIVEQAKIGADEEPTPREKQADNETPPLAATDNQEETADEKFGKIMDMIGTLTQKVDSLTAANSTDEHDPLAALVEELTESPQDNEAAETVPADELPEAADEDTEDEEGPVMPPEDRPENPIPSADKAAAIAAINAIKPIIAKLPENQRRAASDAAVREIRKAMGKDAKPKTNGYTGITRTQRQTAKPARTHADDAKVGKNIMETRNPHYMKKEGK